jgi:hypothetical protein
VIRPRCKTPTAQLLTMHEQLWVKRHEPSLYRVSAIVGSAYRGMGADSAMRDSAFSPNA